MQPSLIQGTINNIFKPNKYNNNSSPITNHLFIAKKQLEHNNLNGEKNRHNLSTVTILTPFIDSDSLQERLETQGKRRKR